MIKCRHGPFFYTLCIIHTIIMEMLFVSGACSTMCIKFGQPTEASFTFEQSTSSTRTRGSLTKLIYTTKCTITICYDNPDNVRFGGSGLPKCVYATGWGKAIPSKRKVFNRQAE